MRNVPVHFFCDFNKKRLLAHCRFAKKLKLICI